MSCWKCMDCGMKNCDTEECINPKCPTNKKPEFVKIDTFPKVGDTFSTGFPDKVTREF